jgi:hypothetical protein
MESAPLELNLQCVIEHVNVRRGKNDESEVAIDIDLSCEDVPTSFAAGALRVSEDEINDSFFDAEGNPKFLGIGSLPVDEQWEGKHQVKISSLSRMRVTKLRKIKLKPRGGKKWDVGLQVQIEQPPENYIESIADKLHRSANVRLEHDNRELDLPKQDSAKAPGRVKKSQGEQASMLN